MKQIRIGLFKVISGRIVASDPCYEIGTWCQGVLDGVRKGKWVADVLVDQKTQRIAEIIVHHQEWTNLSSSWIEAPFEVGVDSGQAGVFDAQHYRDDSVVMNAGRKAKEIICPEEPWYSICCDRTLSSQSAGIIPYGAVCSSRYGDGAYRCYTQKDNNNEIAVVRIVFIVQKGN